MKKLGKLILLIGLAAILSVGCTKEQKEEKKQKTTKETKAPEEAEAAPKEDEKQKSETQEEQQAEETPVKKGKLIVIDAGHQLHGNNEKEPIGPGASETKPKVASGTSGAATGINEYELTLTVSLQLEQELKNRGYEVIMVRTTNEVDLSNAGRAAIANQANADAFLRIHANGSENASVQGALTMCMTPGNPYNGNLYDASRRLSETILNEFCNATGAKKCNIIETDKMSGINWCSVPVTIVEMGYMSNAAEDQLLNSQDYQTKMVQGMANGLDQYFSAN